MSEGVDRSAGSCGSRPAVLSWAMGQGWNVGLEDYCTSKISKVRTMGAAWLGGSAPANIGGGV